MAAAAQARAEQLMVAANQVAQQQQQQRQHKQRQQQQQEQQQQQQARRSPGSPGSGGPLSPAVAIVARPYQVPAVTAVAASGSAGGNKAASSKDGSSGPGQRKQSPAEMLDLLMRRLKSADRPSSAAVTVRERIASFSITQKPSRVTFNMGLHGPSCWSNYFVVYF
jgi:hypothetical protein